MKNDEMTIKIKIVEKASSNENSSNNHFSNNSNVLCCEKGMKISDILKNLKKESKSIDDKQLFNCIKDILVAKISGKIVDLSTEIFEDSEVEFLLLILKKEKKSFGIHAPIF